MKLTERQESEKLMELSQWAEHFTEYIHKHDEVIDAFQQFVEKQIEDAIVKIIPNDRMPENPDPGVQAMYDHFHKASIMQLRLIHNGYFWKKAYDHRVSLIVAKYTKIAIASEKDERKAAERERLRGEIADHPYKGTDRRDVPARELDDI